MGRESFPSPSLVKEWFQNPDLKTTTSREPPLKAQRQMAVGQKTVPPVNIPIPTKIASKMGGEFTYPKMGSYWF